MVAVDRRTSRVVGTSRYAAYDERRSEVEIGWTFLVRSLWGGEFNAEMKRLMLEHAFRYVDRVLFLVDRQNIRSQRAVEKIGAMPIGARPDGRGGERLVYAIRHSGR